jgi:hypothetical protein
MVAKKSRKEREEKLTTEGTEVHGVKEYGSKESNNLGGREG